MEYPDNKRFAFTILDDTDCANLSNVEPIYRYLESIGMRTTKTVWPLAYEDHLNSPYMYSSTLEEPEYVDFVLWLKSKGFEITWHGPTMESSKRSDILKGLELFKEIIGFYPSLHVNHAMNLDNIYWGLQRFDSPVIKQIFKLMSRSLKEFSGEKEGSDFFWGDYVVEHVKYCRSFTFSQMNSLNINPSLPYRDSNRSAVDYWFATADADSVIEFEELVTPRNIDRLVSEGGICILSTHLAKGYCKGGDVRDSVKRQLDYLAKNDGWFVPVSEILDWRLNSGAKGNQISSIEKSSMEYRWLYEQVKNRVRINKNKVPWWDY